MLEQINKENFQHMLNQFSTNELEGMIEKFPYFQQAHLLLAKKYQQENSPKFDQQLQLAALYVQDRELLYNLFNERNSTTAAPTIQTGVVETVKIEEKTQETETATIIAPEIIITDKLEVEEITAAAQKIAAVAKEDETDLKRQIELIEESARRLNQIIENTLEEPKEETATIITEPEAVILDQVEVEETHTSRQIVVEEIREEDPDLRREIELIRESAQRLNQIIENTAEEEKPEMQLAQPEVKEEQIETQAAPLVEEPEEQITEEVALQEEPPLQTFSRIEPHTFDEWLKAFNNKSVPEIKESPVVEESTPSEEDELTQLLTTSISVDYLHELVKEETTYAKGLERFIDDQIQKHKHPEVKKSAPEKDFQTDPATETMAKVYEMQKKYSKAIKTYEALTLKFPEKSSLFAARITYLKNIV